VCLAEIPEERSGQCDQDHSNDIKNVSHLSRITLKLSGAVFSRPQERLVRRSCMRHKKRLLFTLFVSPCRRAWASQAWLSQSRKM
jgi:hypothetical protein